MDSDKKLPVVGARLVALIEDWPDDVSGGAVEQPGEPEQPMTPEEERQLREAWQAMTPAQRQRAYLAAVIMNDDEHGETYQQFHAAMMQSDFVEVNRIIDGLL